MKILVTGFKPFLGEALNPSQILAETSGVEFVVLPVEFSASFAVLKTFLEKNKYDYLLMLGQAAGRSKVSFEKIALNWVQTEHRDESGHTPDAGPISQGRELAFMSLFPVDEVYQQLKAEQSPVEISFSAGTYVCNDLYFRVRESFPELKSVFIHFPLIEEQIVALRPRPFIALGEQKQILKRIIELLG